MRDDEAMAALYTALTELRGVRQLPTGAPASDRVTRLVEVSLLCRDAAAHVQHEITALSQSLQMSAAEADRLNRLVTEMVRERDAARRRGKAS